MDREILGIDHGNRQMKTANTAFLSTVTQNKVKRNESENERLFNQKGNEGKSSAGKQ